MSRQNKSANQQPPPQQPPAPVVTSAPAPPKEYTECSIQVKTSGGNIQGTFKPTDNLQTVLNFVNSNAKGKLYSSLSTTFPRKQYSGAALASTTLLEAELVPRGAVIAS
eukprot:TRINITY_DN1750_c0_g2_i3.p1 TRINITY_DN1750_c0_g2~~TRINITY_DN1750_c0_g2_i3.p1  ORF type:complete len:109 (+),score=31.65 TRINITY_DN1750_c0_g2_i3:188-514(+)